MSEQWMSDGLREILTKARELVANDWSVRDALYECAVNGESESAAVLAIYRDGGMPSGVASKAEALAVFDRVLAR